MNAFQAIITFAAVCTLPACFAVPTPCGQIPPCDWSPCSWSPYTNLAYSNGLLSAATLPALASPYVDSLLLSQPSLYGAYGTYGAYGAYGASPLLASGAAVLPGPIISNRPSPVVPKLVTEKIVSVPSVQKSC